MEFEEKRNHDEDEDILPSVLKCFVYFWHFFLPVWVKPKTQSRLHLSQYTLFPPYATYQVHEL